MNATDANLTVVPPPVGRPSDGARCELCGAWLSLAGVCEACVHGLLDLALGDEANITAVPADRPRSERTALPDLSEERFEHFAVCRRPDGSLWELGRGAMGITYRAFDTSLLCPVALKIINGALTGDPQARERFLHEARSAARLRHPHIATILHLGQGGGECFYAMEFIEGETLESLLVRRAGGLPLPVALEIIIQTARALAAAHAENLVHRDIKPANIMLARHETAGEDVHVKVIDFGLAKLAAEENPAWCDWYFAGTPHYASPEQLAGRPVDARSDIYSLGVVLWRALAGESVFSTQTVRDAKFNDGTKHPDALPPPPAAWLQTLPAPLRSLLPDMLQPDPSLRPPTAVRVLARCQECRAELSAHRAGIALASSSSSKDRTSRSGRRASGQWTVPLGLTALIVTVILLAVAGRKPLLATAGSWLNHSRQAEALELFHRARPYARTVNEEEDKASIDLLKQAVRLDPGMAEAHAALAWSYTRRVNMDGGSPRNLDLALASAERAVALNPRLSDGHLALGYVQTYRGAQWESLAEYRRAIELDPHSVRAMAGFGLQWVMLGYPQKGLPWLLGSARESPQAAYLGVAMDAYIDLCADEQAEKCGMQCEAMDPTRLTAYRQMLHFHLLQGNFARARQDLLDANALQKDDLPLRTLAAQLELYSGNLTAAEVTYCQLYDGGRQIALSYYGSMSYPSILCWLAYRAGRKEEGDALLKAAQALHADGADGPQATYDLAAVRCLEGRQEEALALLRKSVAAGWLDFRSTLIDPRFEALRQDAGFVALIDALRLKVSRLREEALARAQRPLNIADYPVTVSP